MVPGICIWLERSFYKYYSSIYHNMNPPMKIWQIQKKFVRKKSLSYLNINGGRWNCNVSSYTHICVYGLIPPVTSVWPQHWLVSVQLVIRSWPCVTAVKFQVGVTVFMFIWSLFKVMISLANCQAPFQLRDQQQLFCLFFCLRKVIIFETGR